MRRCPGRAVGDFDALSGPDDSFGGAAHYLLSALIAAHERQRHIQMSFLGLDLLDPTFARYGVAREDWADEIEDHVPGNVVHVATKLGGDSRSQEPLDHDPPVDVSLHVVYPLVSRNLGEGPHVICGESPLVCRLLARFYLDRVSGLDSEID